MRILARVLVGEPASTSPEHAVAHIPAKLALELDPRVSTGSPISICANKNL
jgi:hypothetical protein